MSYESQLKERTNSFLQPTSLALLASVVLHLLVYKFGLPYFKLENKPSKREVSIVELSPEQQARLPRLYPEANIPELEELPELDNPSSDTPAPPFALPPSLTPGIGNFPNLPPVAIPLPPEFDIPPLPPLPNTNIKLPPIGDLSKLPPPPSLESFEPPAAPAKTSTTPPVKPPPPPEAKPQPSAPPPKKSEPAPAPKPEPKPSPQQIAAQRQQNLQQEVRSLSSSLQKQSGATTDEDARKNYVAWLNRVKAIAPENLEIAGTYPRDACIRRLEGTSIFGVVVNAKGEVVASDLLKGAEYPVFDLQGGKDLSKLSFDNDTNQPKPYRVTLNYKYDSETCPSLTLPLLREDKKPTPNKQSPQPEAETPKQPIEGDKEPQSKESQAPKTQPVSTDKVESTQPEAETSDTAEAIEKQNSSTPTEEPSLREKLRNVPLLPSDRLSLPEQPESVRPDARHTNENKD